MNPAPLKRSRRAVAAQAGPSCAVIELAATRLARRPYDLRHAALSLWLNAGGDAARSLSVRQQLPCARGHAADPLPATQLPGSQAGLRPVPAIDLP